MKVFLCFTRVKMWILLIIGTKLLENLQLFFRFFQQITMLFYFVVVSRPVSAYYIVTVREENMKIKEKMLKELVNKKIEITAQ